MAAPCLALRRYVSVESVRQLSERWPGSEMRLVSGGHVTGYLMHQVRVCDVAVMRACLAWSRGAGHDVSMVGWCACVQDKFREAILDSLDRVVQPPRALPGEQGAPAAGPAPGAR